jgi:hypothetical protein
MSRRRVRKLQGIFRILDGWKIDYRRATKEYSAKVVLDKKRKRAIVFGYGAKNVPADYWLHEILHCALTQFTRMDKRKPKEIIQAEELLVQDICWAWKNKKAVKNA